MGQVDPVVICFPWDAGYLKNELESKGPQLEILDPKSLEGLKTISVP